MNPFPSPKSSQTRIFNSSCNALIVYWDCLPVVVKMIWQSPITRFTTREVKPLVIQSRKIHWNPEVINSNAVLSIKIETVSVNPVAPWWWALIPTSKAHCLNLLTHQRLQSPKHFFFSIIFRFTSTMMLQQRFGHPNDVNAFQAMTSCLLEEGFWSTENIISHLLPFSDEFGV